MSLSLSRSTVPCSRRPADLWQVAGPITLVALVLGTGSCRESPSPDGGITPPDSTIPSTRVDGPASLPGFEAAELRADPGLATWDTETFNEAASSLLKDLAHALHSATPPAPESLAGFTSPDLSISDLLPPSLETAFRDEEFTVERPAPETNSAGSHHDLAAPLEALLSPRDEHSLPEAEFKITGVRLAEATAETTVLVHLAWATDTRRYQVNSTWTCHWDTSDEHPVLSSIVNRPQDFERITRASPDPLLSDQTAAVLGHEPAYRDQLRRGSDYWMSRIEGAYGIDLMDPQGIAVADVDGDGLEDLYLCQPGGLPNRLFLGRADGTATEASAPAGVDFLDFCRHALFADLDNDGDQDLAALLTTTAVILANDGKGVFEERTRLPVPGSPYSFTAADYDQDQLLDLFLTVRDADPSNRSNSLLGDPVPYHDANNGGANVLLRNEGGLRFRETTREAGLDANNRRFSQAAGWEDYDNDGDLDLYVANDFGRNNLYRNDGGRFTDVAAEAGVQDLSAGMSVSWGDYNRDGRMDLYVGNMFSSAGNRIAYQRQFRSGSDAASLEGFRRHARGNSLFENTGGGRFRDVSLEAGVTMGRWAWASPFLDFNNDGWLDLAVANGFITNSDSGDL